MDAPLLCPRDATPMVPVPDAPGAWRCPTCRGEFLDNEPDETQTEPAADEAQARSLAPTGTDGAPDGRRLGESYAAYLQRTLGLMGLINWAPQGSNVGDGSRCLMLGGVAHGGGSKSGRRRKNPKGGKKFADSPWEER